MSTVEQEILSIYRKEPCKKSLPQTLMKEITYSMMKRNTFVVWNIEEIFRMRYDILWEYLNDDSKEPIFKTSEYDFKPMYEFINFLSVEHVLLVLYSNKRNRILSKMNVVNLIHVCNNIEQQQYILHTKCIRKIKTRIIFETRGCDMF